MAGRQCIVVVKLLLCSVAFFKEFIEYLQLFGKGIGFLIILNPFLLGTQVFYNNFSLFGVVPKIRGKGFFFFVGDLN